MVDLVVRNGNAGGRHRRARQMADVVVTDGRITAVEAAGTASTVGAHRVLEADGRLVTPGFVDVHTHYDAQVTWDPWVTPSSWHGVTTVVMGNCGVGFAPAAPDRHEWLIDLMEGVEDIPGSAMTEGISWDWTTLPRVPRRGGRARPGCSTSARRSPTARCGPSSWASAARPTSRPPPQDRDAMGRLVAEALAAGALGFSTSRTPLHRSKAGELVPGTDADADELLAIGDAMARAGHGVFQFAPDHVRVPVDEWPWMEALARRSGRTVSVNLNQPDQAPEVWREVLGLLDGAAADGLSMVAQVAGRSIGILYCLHGSVHPLLFHPAYAEVADLAHGRAPRGAGRPGAPPPADRGGARRRRALPEGRARQAGPHVAGARRRHRLRADRRRIDRRRAAAQGVPAMQLVVDQLTADDGNGMIYAPFFNYGYGDLSMTYEATLHPRTRIGLSDAGAHCGAICDGGTPTFMLTHWARDRRRGPTLPLEHVVRRQTRQTAELYGLHDRGLVAPGQRADLNVIDFEALSFGLPRMAFDLPAGGRRLVQRAAGYVATFVGGVQTVADDEFTGELPGRLVRGPQPSS